MATIATMAMLKPAAKIVARSAPSTSGSSKVVQSVTLRLPQKKATGLATASASSSSYPPAAAALAGAFFSALAASPDAALAAQQAATDDNRGTLLLVVVAPAIAWVLYNILQPALNQLNRMRSGAVVAAGLGGLGAAAGLLASAPEASAAAQDVLGSLAAAAPAAAQDVLGSLAAAAPADDNRGTLLLIVVAPAIAWVLYNILQPALNQLNRMRND